MSKRKTESAAVGGGGSKAGYPAPDTHQLSGAFAGMKVDGAWEPELFKKGFSIDITKMSDESMEFDMIGIDPPLANAFRRILIAEVPTIAISRVTMLQNTGVIHDEMLAHRLGLIPIVIDPDLLDWKPTDAEFSESNSVKFKLNVDCKEDRCSVYSRDLEWVPLSEEQRKKFKDSPPRPVDPDILIARLREYQEIDCECLCEKGYGKEHAKWSPVCTAFYRLKPLITLTREICGKDAEELQRICGPGVIELEDMGGGKQRAVVADTRKCTTCKEVIEALDVELKGVSVGTAKDHYLFTIESTGSVPAPLLFEKALAKLKEKCAAAKAVLTERGE